MMRLRFHNGAFMASALLIWSILSAFAPVASSGNTGLAEMSIEDLMALEIVTATKRPVRLADSAAAVFIITQEDIRRSGALTIPDALRLVPGLNVARIEANQWAVSSRGFNGRFANKLLVMIDGRSIYAPSFAGVYWELVDVILEDVERIEVIRGPGGALWGANAVNGVINIITKSARDTRGGLVTMGIGTEDRSIVGARYGLRIGDDDYARVYAKQLSRDGFVDASGRGTSDDGHIAHAGFRRDWNLSSDVAMTLQGDYYAGEFDQVLGYPSLVPPSNKLPVEDSARVEGGNLLLRWVRDLSPGQEVAVQVYYEWSNRKEGAFSENLDTFDIDLNHRLQFGEAHTFIWGLGFRHTLEVAENTFYIGVDPRRRRDDLFSAFVQDEVELLTDRLFLTVGTKVEDNDYSGLEWQPSLRLLWKPREHQRFWSAISKGVRTPTRIEHDGTIHSFATEGTGILPIPGLIRIDSNDDFGAEELWAFEAGYRAQASPTLSLDVAGFYNVYDNLRTGEPGTPSLQSEPSPPHVLVPFTPENKGSGKIFGLELAVDWRPVPWLKLQGAYSFLRMDIDLDADSRDVILSLTEDENPRHQVSLMSSFDLPSNMELDAWLRYVDELPYLETDSYITMDLRLGWKPTPNLVVSLIGHNILEDHHREFERELYFLKPVEVQRAVTAQVVWTF